MYYSLASQSFSLCRKLAQRKLENSLENIYSVNGPIHTSRVRLGNPSGRPSSANGIPNLSAHRWRSFSIHISLSVAFIHVNSAQFSFGNRSGILQHATSISGKVNSEIFPSTNPAFLLLSPSFSLFFSFSHYSFFWDAHFFFKDCRPNNRNNKNQSRIKTIWKQRRLKPKTSKKKYKKIFI